MTWIFYQSLVQDRLLISLKAIGKFNNLICSKYAPFILVIPATLRGLPILLLLHQNILDVILD